MGVEKGVGESFSLQVESMQIRVGFFGALVGIEEMSVSVNF